MCLAVCKEAFVERLEGRVPARSRWQGGRVERTAQLYAACGDLALTTTPAAILVERSQASEGPGLFAASMPAIISATARLACTPLYARCTDFTRFCQFSRQCA